MVLHLLDCILLGLQLISLLLELRNHLLAGVLGLSLECEEILMEVIEVQLVLLKLVLAVF